MHKIRVFLSLPHNWCNLHFGRNKAANQLKEAIAEHGWKSDPKLTFLCPEPEAIKVLD